MRKRLYIAALLALGAAVSIGGSSSPPPLSPRIRAVLNTINPGELKADLSFLASDALQGRFTPSPGLEVAAEFIASKFRGAGLEPGGDQDYFQVANMVERRLPKPVSSLMVETGSKTITVGLDALQITQAGQAAKVRRASAVIFPTAEAEALEKSDVTGKAVFVTEPDFSKMPRDKEMAEYRKIQRFNRAVASSGAAVEVVIRDRQPTAPATKLLSAEDAQRHTVPIIVVRSPELLQILREPDPERQIKTATVDIAGPEDRRVSPKNVIGILRGSDPKLKDTCVLLTAHYDHIGTSETGRGMSPQTKAPANGDRIYNGANDDGSGTVSVVEIARALAKLYPRPKRSLVFITFFGEERGEIGSQFYGQHPVFPLAKTVADINLEQVGRTDSSNGKQINTASMTGYDYSDVTQYLARAGLRTGIKVYKDNDASDQYFEASDNYALAEKGVPAHSLCTAFEFPDYHGLGDEWQKIDYENMASVDRMVMVGLLEIANDLKAPAWNAQNRKTTRFREAQGKSRRP